MATRAQGAATRARVIETARTLINRQGFRNTTINDVIEATGVKKGNLYFHFPSKEDLALSILKEVEKEFFVFMTENLRGKGPLKKLSNFFDAILEKHRRLGFIGGCIVGNIALEMSDHNEQFSRIIKRIFQRWTTATAELLMEARANGALKTNIPPSVLARTIVGTIEGGIMMSRVSKDEKDLKNCLDSLRALLGIQTKRLQAK